LILIIKKAKEAEGHHFVAHAEMDIIWIMPIIIIL
jgi:hypothetical protein